MLWPSFSPLLIFILRSFCCYRGCASRVIIAKVSAIPSTIPANPRPVCNIRSGQVVRAEQGPIPGPRLAAELIPGKLERRARNVNEDPSLVILSEARCNYNMTASCRVRGLTTDAQSFFIVVPILARPGYHGVGWLLGLEGHH